MAIQTYLSGIAWCNLIGLRRMLLDAKNEFLRTSVRLFMWTMLLDDNNAFQSTVHWIICAKVTKPVCHPALVESLDIIRANDAYLAVVMR